MLLQQTNSTRLVDDPVDLNMILEPEVTLAILRRGIAEPVARYLDKHVPSLNGKVTAECDPRNPNVDDLMTFLPMEEGYDLFREDLLYQIELLHSIISSTNFVLKLDCVKNILCPAFHVDWVSLRLICCYHDPATEWLENDQVDRTRLTPNNGGLPDESSGLLLPGAEVKRMQAYDIALMKGESWPGNQGRGLVHRSPAVAEGQGKRLLFKIDLHGPAIA
ncbi:MAG: DUF1826 domain-containing protein [Gemmataceae bacterium]